MAILVERKKAKVNWLALFIGLFALIFVAATVYFLFIAKVPLIESIISPPSEEVVVKGVKDILGSGIEVQDVIKKLEKFEDPISLPTPGELGRENPFLPI